MTRQEYQNILDELIYLEKQRRLEEAEFYMKHRIDSYLNATRAGMRYFIYAGTVIRDSLHFCRNKVNQLFSIDELMMWRIADIKNYDPVLHLGGNKCCKEKDFCIHGLNFVTINIAKAFRPGIVI